jgi:hypothetical protein
MAIANSERVEQAAEPSAVSRRIFRNFRDATIALLDCDDLPEGVGKAVDHMLDYFNNELGGADEDPIDNARRVMSNVFELDEEEGAKETPVSHHKEIRAERFTLVDEAGNEHARLRIAGGGAVLTMTDSRGRPRLRLRAGDDEATITVCGERGDAGKGVPPAADEAARVTIGYESAAREARIVIQDGNERECVALSIFADGDGFIRLRQPCDGRHTIVDSDGLIAFDGQHEPLPEYRDREASAPETEPETIAGAVHNGADHSPADTRVSTEHRFGLFLNSDRARSPVSQEDIRNLVDRIIPRDDDDAVRAFVALIDRIAYDRNHVERDGLALYACNAAYQRTCAYHVEAEKFFDEAAAESRLRA